MKASDWLIGLMTAVFVIGGITTFYIAVDEEYSITDFDSSKYTGLDKQAELDAQAYSLHDNASNIDTDYHLITTELAWYTKIFRSVKLVFSSADTISDLGDSTAQGMTPLGEGVNRFKGYAVMIVIILISLLVISAIWRWKFA